MLSVLLPAPLPLKAEPLEAEDLGAEPLKAEPLKAEPPGAVPATPIENAAPSDLRELRAGLGGSDRTVALRALQMALTELGDGVTLVWRLPGRQLTGRVKPKSAFRDETGRICRTLVYTLARGANEKQIEGIACREVSGRWTIVG